MAKQLEFDNDTGIVTVRIGKKAYKIDPPTLGVMRDLDLLAAKLDRESAAEAEAEAAKKAPEEVAAETAEELTQRPLHEKVGEVMPWWRLLFEKCADGELPPDDDCPIWFGTTLIVARIHVFWMMHPFLALGSSAPPGAVGETA